MAHMKESVRVKGGSVSEKQWKIIYDLMYYLKVTNTNTSILFWYDYRKFPGTNGVLSRSKTRVYILVHLTILRIRSAINDAFNRRFQI